ncbi:anti-adapter protein IraP [Pantoea ananatis]|nr:anti-adapter protein IraP [Pantoea ananatis]PZD64632.1 anti-adapter protein IraP [Pantoea ananatis]
MMKSAVLSMLAKISKMDAETKELVAQTEAQSLLLSALTLTVGKSGGVEELISAISQAINTVLESSDGLIKSDAELLLTKFQEQLTLTQLVDEESKEFLKSVPQKSLPSVSSNEKNTDR